MAENTPTVNLNKAWLQAFLTDDIGPFRVAISALNGEGESPIDSVPVPAVFDLVAEGGGTAVGFLDGQVKPLAIGTMATETGGRTNGGNVATKLAELVEQVTAILKHQGELFEEIEDDLEATIKDMFKTQDENMDKIDGKKFVNFFEDVDSILSEGPGSTEENND
ncbi:MULTISPECIES: type VII secretion system-associated protein [Streptomyces]|uniref:Type VII secretion system-associated protein n=1 Tax=Streptomyces sp. NBC_00093 TaxID=2975649 RepID=A0AAU2A5T5_9ACTN